LLKICDSPITIQVHFLTEDFNPFLMNFGYFTTKNYTLKNFILAASILFPVLSVSAQGNIEFIENKGQWDSRVLFMGRVNNGAFFIRKEGFTVVQYNTSDYSDVYQYIHNGNTQALKTLKLRGQAFHVDFQGASPNVKVVPDKAVASYNNYFVGTDPSKWAGGCRLYQAVTVQNVYPNVDVRFYTDNNFLKYDIIAKPGADISRIALKYDGIEKLEVKNRELVIGTSLGDLRETMPTSYQTNLRENREVVCRYNVSGKTVRFDVRDYDPKSTLVIDPSVVFCSFSGSTADNWGFTATYGADGSMYGGGIVFGSGFPVSTGAFQTSFQNGPFDIGIIKLTPDGSNRVYATYIGGSGEEQPHSLIVDNSGQLVLAGRTNSPVTGTGAYPLKNPATDVVGVCGGYDIVVTKLNANGTGIIGSKRIGGSGKDGVNIDENRGLGTTSLMRNYGDDGRSEVILDAGANVYVASCTQSSDFPIRGGGFQGSSGGAQDGALIKLSPDLSTVIFSTYLGGNGNDAAYVLSIAPSGNIYVAGGTESTAASFPGNETGTIGPSNNGGVDGYVLVANNSGTSVVRSTFLGTSGADQVYGIQFDQLGFPYVMGQTTGSWPITAGTPTFGSSSGKQFIAKLQPDLSAWVYSTVFGTGSVTPNISPIAFLVDRCENVYISGWGGFYGTTNWYNSAGTTGLPITAGAIKSNTDGKDFYFFVLKKDATQQLYGSFFGEFNRPGYGCDHVDGGTSRFDKDGKIYQAICANCNLDPNVRPVFPTTVGSWAPNNVANTRAECNLAMLKIDMNLAGVRGGIQSVIDGVPRDSAGCVPLTVDFIDTVGNAVTYEWDFGDGSPRVTTNVPFTQYTYNVVGNYLAMLIAIDPNTCNVRDTSYVNIRVGDLKAILNASNTKIGPCTSFDYRFDNLSTTDPTRPFQDTSFMWIWGDGSAPVIAGMTSVTHSFPAPGTYIVQLVLKDTAYCNNPDTFDIELEVAENVIARFTTPSVGCRPYTAIFDNTSVAGQTWLWDFGDGTTSTDFEPTHFYPLPGPYTITLTATNPNTCNVTSTFTYNITVVDKPVALFTWGPDPPLVNTPANFTNLSSADAVSFKWVFGDGDSLVTTSRATVQHQYNATGTFNACLTAYNSAGCDSTVCMPVKALIEPLVDVPNAFTPLSGDINSIVTVKGFGIGKIQFIIWNRWGQKVFETNNRFQGWDGKIKGVVQPMDVYVYTLNIEFTDGTKATKKGDITLIR
jgi:gliding motility-associated-like protein